VQSPTGKTIPAVRRGIIALADLNPTVGQEHSGRRPCVVIGDSAIAAHQRFPLLLIAPLTSTQLTGLLYPELAPSSWNGLTKTSYVLVDHLRSIDKQRVIKTYGGLNAAELAAVDKALRALLGL
jgi:mRNA interferase MazF